MLETGATRESIEHALWSAFVSRAILPGQPVIVGALAYQWHVSSDELCAALAVMAEKGLVLATPDGGFEARPLLSERETAELYVVRNRLEPWAAEQAATTTLAPDAHDLLRSLASVPVSPTITVLAERDGAFHSLVARLSGLMFAAGALDSLHSEFHIYRRLDGHTHAPTSDNEHESIAEAIIAGDAQEARLAMQRHLSASSARLIALGP